MKKILSIIALAFVTISANAQSITEKYQRFLTDPYGYVAYRTNGPIKIDGVIDEPDWAKAQPTEKFADISGEGFPTPRFETYAKILWDDDYLYIAGDIAEPDVWADITKHDEVIFKNPDFEVFLDPDNDAQNYFEIETNAIGTVWELFIQKPYRALTPTFVTFSWDCPGLKVDTHIYGTLNYNKDTDKGWTIELAIPHTAIAEQFANYYKAGNYLRLGFSRVEWQTESDANGKSTRKSDGKGGVLPEDNWTWPSTGQIAMHMPERWGYLYLSGKTVGEGTEEFQYPAERPIEKLLWAMFYAQETHKSETGAYYSKLKDFKLTASEKALLPTGATIRVEALTNRYEIIVTKADGSSVSIDENGYVCRRDKK